MTSPNKPKTTGLNVAWQERQDWEEIRHLAETALKVLEETSTRDLAPALIPRVERFLEHLKTLAPTAKENKSNE